jgi:hypothetical protein
MQKVLKYILVSLLTFYNQVCFSQHDTTAVAQIKIYTHYLDSVSEVDFGYNTHVEDGTIIRDNVVIAGYGVYTLSNLANVTAFRIEYHDNLEVNLYKTFYYKSNLLLFAKMELKDVKGNSRVLYSREEYYKDGKLIFAQTNDTKASKAYVHRLPLPLWEEGNKFLNEFRKANSRVNT